jgi:MinD superfamily P-loop ATPase
MTTSAVTPSSKQLVVLSGKGGTGKTSIVAALAALKGRTVLADCDVDAANLHLLLDPRLQHREPFFAGLEARIAAERCSSCGDCMNHCRFDAILPVDQGEKPRRYAVDHLACEGCGLCSEICPSNAVELFEPQRGELFVSHTIHGPLVHAQLSVGGENSGKLVTVVRDRALSLAQEAAAGLVIIDGPPGIGCPVIASVTGADLVLAVTEPTVSGKHDLERIVSLVRSFDIPLAVCINKRDINPEVAADIRRTCAELGIPVVGEIDYDADVVRAQVAGISIMDYDGGRAAEQIREMWTNLETTLFEVEA